MKCSIKSIISITVANLLCLFIIACNTKKNEEKVTTSDKGFTQEVLKSDVPVLVDFWAPWCGACKVVAPVIEELEAEYKGKIKVYRVNVDDSPDLAKDYNIRAIPTFYFFKNGKIYDSIVGAYTKEEFRKRIDNVISAK